MTKYNLLQHDDEEILLDDKTDIHFCKERLILTKNSPSFDIMRWDMGILSGKMYVANLRDDVNRGMNYNFDWKISNKGSSWVFEY